MRITIPRDTKVVPLIVCSKAAVSLYEMVILGDGLQYTPTGDFFPDPGNRPLLWRDYTLEPTPA